MKKLVISILAIFFISPVFAAQQIVHLGVTAGYSYAKMSDLEDDWNKAKQYAEESLGESITVDDYGNGLFTNLSLEIGLMPLFSPSLQVGFQYIFPATHQVYEEIDVFGTPTFLTVDYEESAYLIPLMLGFDTNISAESIPVSISIGVYAGYGLSYATQTVQSPVEIAPGVDSFTVLYDGGGFLMDFAVAFEVYPVDNISIGINAAYRYADIMNMNVTDKVEIGGETIYDPGMEMTGLDGQKISVDYSGILAGISVNIRI